MKVVAGLAGELQLHPRPEACLQMTVEAWSGDHDRYAAKAEAFLASHPHADRLADVLSAESLQELSTEGEVLDAFDDSAQWIGLGAHHPESLFGAPGVAMYEELIADRFRRQGYGTALQRNLIDRVPKDLVLWGHIHAGNVASLQTAFRLGRTELGEFRLYEFQ